jgi:uncharacterized protein (TIGR02594 family)
MTTEEIQRALLRAGNDPKGIDGIWGRNSIAATEAFQRAKNLKPVDGIVGPITLKALFPDGAQAEAVAAPLTPPWYQLALTKKGLQEKLNNKELRAFLGSDGHALGDPSVLPWCGDFVETCIALTCPKEPMVVNPYWAQNWAKFGKKLTRGAIGAILVFGRDGGGHVAFYAGEDATTYTILGGNQSNAVTIMRIAKNRLVENGIRWPATYVAPTGGPVTATGAPISHNEA